jgi:peptidoglycan/xylan/chitin deacetylase (PgdA/CDA1 family)
MMDHAMRHERGMRRIAVALAAGVLLAIVLVEPAAADSSRVASHGPRTNKVVALTIDDGYNPKACRAIFEILERRHVPATFFPVADAMRAAPALWREIAARGYPIGDHTADHSYLAGKSVAAQQAAISAGRAIVRRITGRASIRVLRPPAAEWDGNTTVAASRAGEQLILLWDTTFGDTSWHRVESHLIRNGTRGHNGSVILMHCNHAISAAVLERVIDSYRARGFTFVTIPQLFGLPGPAPTYPNVPPIVAWQAGAIARAGWSLTD